MGRDPQPETAAPSAGPPPSWRRWLRRGGLLVGACVVALSLAEAALQVAGVDIRTERLVRDPLLGWRNRPGYSDGSLSINSHGCVGPEFSAEKPPGLLRVVCLGDSCTAGDLLPHAEDRYPRQLARELPRCYPGQTFQVINAGVGGYSAVQGRLWLEREVLDWAPDLVVIYFGWNDHWPARAGGPDSKVAGSWRERLRAWLGWSKVLQLLIRGYRHLARRPVVVKEKQERGRTTVPTDERVRVPLEDYRENLTRMVEATRERGGRCCLVTAPNYLELVARKGRVPTHESLGAPETVEAVIELHARYNQVTREVAQRTGACLVDAAKDFRSVGDPASLFWESPGGSIDFIHLSPRGYARLAEAIAHSPVAASLAQEEGSP